MLRMMVCSPARSLDQVAGLIDLLRIQSRGGLIENQNIRVMDDGLRQPDTLPVSFGESAQQFGFDIGDGATSAGIIDSLCELRAATVP